MRGKSHDEAMAELYRNDPALALEVINNILADGDQAELMTVLRQLAQTVGGVQAVAEQAHLNPTQLYRTLSPKGNPALNSLTAILKTMGLRLAVQPLASAPSAHAA
ncbi:MAG: addiction module antidote protein [Bacteroidetes bacterium]|jgi:probable addiction module antidote protein|uniref:helix-turn-helix domain-containing transcriptional regulator n=1 Tax=Comamonadaceae TaxID=80864 RepID=UPI0006F2405E|nr:MULTISPECIES: hypothetical protein [Comamonadaceae]MBS1942357.1 addiction module antidote protein [Bacteroidota bacterium]MDN4588644.1 addiction module antidote protein [Xenophilus aerolatus]KQX87873.1 addiction module antidote protein [Variovorax sp. Root473]MBU7574692.1 addiction module antidote protein [Hydrogenophaga sp.]MBW0171496.1 addiction module antidote protein [Hydrogenophaga sp.]|eukprot:GILI01021580.1.p2 GENE.GILI01021580.1~~GILI01021580.1.p2  ORF type:complete len:106 (-),score=26.22 GILI01021580.1:66-383(-)